jgi:cytochrome d ubiquinol oxidase subunit I
MEAHWPASAPAGLYLLGMVDEASGETRGLELPGLVSWMIHGNPEEAVTGLEAFPEEDRPPVQATFQLFHLMVGIGFGLIGVSLLGIFFWWRGTLFSKRWFLWLLVFSVLGPQVANQAGWFTAEIGRQPWIVYGYLRTSEGLSKTVEANQVLTSLIMFGLIYALLFAVFIFLLDQKIRKGPSGEGEADLPEGLEAPRA